MSAALASVDSETGEPQQHVVTSAVNKVVEGLRGDAFDIAMDISKDVLVTPKGIDQLIRAIRISLWSKSDEDPTGRCRDRTVNRWPRIFYVESAGGNSSQNLTRNLS